MLRLNLHTKRPLTSARETGRCDFDYGSKTDRLLVVTSSNYQEGARLYASHWDILLLTTDQLPTLNLLLGARLEAVALPDETCVGEPFWTIMEIHDGKVTGSYFCRESERGAKQIPLAFSKVHAQQIFAQAGLDPARWAVRGLPRHVLRAFILMMELMERAKGEAILCMRMPGESPDSLFMGVPITREQLALEYYGEMLPRVGRSRYAAGVRSGLMIDSAG